MAFDLFSCFFLFLVSPRQHTNCLQRFVVEIGAGQSERERRRDVLAGIKDLRTSSEGAC